MPTQATGSPEPTTQQHTDIVGISVTPQNASVRRDELPLKLSVVARHEDGTYGPLPENRGPPTYKLHLISGEQSGVTITPSGVIHPDYQHGDSTTQSIWVVADWDVHETTSVITLQPSIQHTLEHMTGLVMKLSTTTLSPGDTVRATVLATYQDGNTGPLPTDLETLWEISSSNQDVASTEDDGQVTGLSPGQAVITATAGLHSTTAVISVLSPGNTKSDPQGCRASDRSDPVPNTLMVELTRGHDRNDAKSLASRHDGQLLPAQTPLGYFIKFPCNTGTTAAQTRKLTELVSRVQAERTVKNVIPLTIAGPTGTPLPDEPTTDPNTTPNEPEETTTTLCEDAVAISSEPTVLTLVPGVQDHVKAIIVHCPDRTNVRIQPSDRRIAYSTPAAQSRLQTGPNGAVTAFHGTPTSDHIILVTIGDHQLRLKAQVRAATTVEHLETNHCSENTGYTGQILAHLFPGIPAVPTGPALHKISTTVNAAIDFTFGQPQETLDPMEEQLHAVVLSAPCTDVALLEKKAEQISDLPQVKETEIYIPLGADSATSGYTPTTHHRRLTLKRGTSLVIKPSARYANGTIHPMNKSQQQAIRYHTDPPGLVDIDQDTGRIIALNPGSTVLTIDPMAATTEGQELTLPIDVLP